MGKNKRLCNLEVWGGIECTINRVGDAFYDQLNYSDFYIRPEVEAITHLGIKKLRFPILWERHQHVRDGSIDWTWTRDQLLYFKKNNIDIIAGLVHHGSGPSFTNLLDPKFPELLASYAKKVAEEFPWLQYFTPVNEPLTTARFSGLYGVWFPHTNDPRGFVQMVINQMKGTVLAMKEIRKVIPMAKLVQTEDLARIYSTPKLKYQADFENQRRWLSYDLLCGKVDENHPLWSYFKTIGIPQEEFKFFQENTCIPDVFGFNYYVTSERYLDENIHLYPGHTHGGNGRHRYADVEAVRVNIKEETGIKRLVKEAWERYSKPIAITEVHLHCHREEQLRWFDYIWNSCSELKEEGIDIQAVTAWALFGSYGWNKLLTVPNGEYEPGVFDLRGGRARPTALTRFIKKLTDGEQHHPYLTSIQGWWQRDCRYIHEPVVSKMQILKTARPKQKPILIIGKNGTLGRAFARICDERAIPYRLMSRQDCDIAEDHSIESAIDFYKPWAIINAAGYVRVDDAEKESDKCFRENHCGPLNLAKACKLYDIKLVSFSSDLVFDGKKNAPYVESDLTNPINIYGRSKEQSEIALKELCPGSLVIRTSAFFSPWDQYNFLHWVETNISNRMEVPVASDVFVSPTYVPDLVHATLDLMIDDEQGIWHLANDGAASWADLAKEVSKRYNGDSHLFIKEVSVDELHLPALRPKFSVLGTERARLLPSLDHALNRYFAEKKQLVEW